MKLTFVETAVFTARVRRLGLEDSLRSLQDRLLLEPDAGDLDPGTGGLRKIRMADPGRRKGKRGGARAHYLWLPHVERVYLMFVFGKGESDTLSPAQKRGLYQIVQAIKAAVREETA